MTAAKTMYWYEAGPMASYVEDDIDLEKAKTIILNDKDVKEIIEDAIEYGHIKSIDELVVEEMHIAPMEPEFDGDLPMHQDEDGNAFWEMCTSKNEGAKKLIGINWEDWFA